MGSVEWFDAHALTIHAEFRAGIQGYFGKAKQIGAWIFRCGWNQSMWTIDDIALESLNILRA